MANGGGRRQNPCLGPYSVISKEWGLTQGSCRRQSTPLEGRSGVCLIRGKNPTNTSSAWECFRTCHQPPLKDKSGVDPEEPTEEEEIRQVPPVHGSDQDKQLQKRNLCAVPASRLSLLYFTVEGGQWGGPATNILTLIVMLC